MGDDDADGAAALMELQQQQQGGQQQVETEGDDEQQGGLPLDVDEGKWKCECGWECDVSDTQCFYCQKSCPDHLAEHHGPPPEYQAEHLHEPRSDGTDGDKEGEKEWAAAPPAFAVGARVVTHGMLKAVQLNGLCGTVVKPADGEGDRVGVDFGPPHGKKAILPANLRFAGGGRGQAAAPGRGAGKG
eukprot:gene55441-61132_t